MGELLYNSEIASLNYDKSTHLLELHWKKSTDSDEYKRLFNLIIE